MSRRPVIATVLLAWVLWFAYRVSEPPHLQNDDAWKPDERFQSKAECDAGAMTAATDLAGQAQARRQTAEIRGEHIILSEPGSVVVITFTLKCLPDSVDPTASQPGR